MNDLHKVCIPVGQRGVSLVVVLSFLSISAMLGVSAMQSSLLEERLSSNYRASTGSQLGAELGAAEFVEWLKEYGWPSSVDEIDESDLTSSELPSIGLVYSIEDGDLSWSVVDGEVSLARVKFTGLNNSADSVAYLFTEFQRGDPGMILIDGAFTCFGAGCVVDTGAGQASNSINGYDHWVDEQGCSIKGSNTPPLNPDGEDKAGLIIPDGSYNEGGAGDNIVGSPNVIDSEEGFSSYDPEGRTVEVADKELQAFINRMIGLAAENPGEISGMKNIAYAGVGQTIEVGDNAGGIVVLEGGTLEFTKGNTCFAGLIVARPGYDGSDAKVIVPSTIDSQGTTAIVGGVIGDRLSYSGNGTPSVYYSSIALDLFAEGSIGDGVEVSQWFNE